MNGLIGNTPMIKIKYRYKEKENFIYAKLEWFNLTGSIKDRLIYYVLNNNNLENITTLVEATSGNTGIALAALGNYYKKKVVIFMPDFVSEERKILLKSFGAKLHLISKKDGGFVKCVKLAKEYARKKDVLLINQFSNKLNIDTHYNTTAKEILNKLNNIGGFVSGVGSGGTLMGVTNRLKEVFPNLKVALVEPKNSEIINKNKVNSHKIEGIADDFIPDNFKKENITHYYSISDEDAITMSKMLAKELGLGIGISSGANFLGSVLLNEDVNNVVTIFSDDNKKYLSILKDDVFIKQDYISNDIKLLGYEVV